MDETEQHGVDEDHQLVVTLLGELDVHGDERRFPAGSKRVVVIFVHAAEVGLITFLCEEVDGDLVDQSFQLEAVGVSGRPVLHLVVIFHPACVGIFRICPSSLVANIRDVGDDVRRRACPALFGGRLRPLRRRGGNGIDGVPLIGVRIGICDPAEHVAQAEQRAEIHTVHNAQQRIKQRTFTAAEVEPAQPNAVVAEIDVQFNMVVKVGLRVPADAVQHYEVVVGNGAELSGGTIGDILRRACQRECALAVRLRQHGREFYSLSGTRRVDHHLPLLVDVDGEVRVQALEQLGDERHRACGL